MDEPATLDEQAIRERAYEISLRADGGTPEENWRRAREELLDEAWAAAALTRAHGAVQRPSRPGAREGSG
jgi:hypothetical protein